MPLPNLNYVEYKERPIILPSEDRFAESINTLSNKHLKALEQTNSIETALANVELNEAEDEWKFNKAAEIRNNIDSKTQFGNYAGALTTAVKEAGKLASDPALLGRVRAQKNYNDFINNLQARKDIDETTKEYYREKNKYFYEDKKDDTGRIVGGSKWEPNKRPVSTVDMSQLMQKAIQLTAKNAGGGNTIYYADSKGNMTTDPNKSADGLPYMNKSGKFEALTKDKLKAGLDAIIANTPGAAESIKQDYDVAVWRTKKDAKEAGNLVISSVTDDKGILLNEQQYLQKRVDPFFKSATYNHIYTENTPLAGMNAAAKRKAAGANKEQSYLNTLSSGTGGTIMEQAQSASTILGKSNGAKSNIIAQAQNLGINPKSNMSVDDIYNEITKKIDSGKLSKSAAQVERINALKFKNEYNENQKIYNKFIENANPEQREAVAFTTAIDNGLDIADLVKSGNKYAKKHVEYINKLFDNNGTDLEISFNNVAQLNRVIKQLDKDNPGYHRTLGINVALDKDGNNSININKENANNLYILANALKEAGAATRKDNSFFKLFTRENINSNYNINILNKSSNNIEVLKSNIGRVENNYTPDLLRDLLDSATGYNDANKIYTSYTETKPSYKNTNFTIYGADDLLMTQLENTGQLQNMKQTEIDKYKENAKESMHAVIRGSDFAHREMFKADEHGTFIPITTGTDRQDVGKKIQAFLGSEAGKKRTTFSYTIKDGQVATVINIAPAQETKNNLIKFRGLDDDFADGIQVVVPELIDNYAAQALKNDPRYQAEYKLNNAGLSGSNSVIVNTNDYNPYIGDSEIEIENGNYYYNVNNDRKKITDNEAKAILAANEEYKNLFLLAKSGSRPDENVDSTPLTNKITQIVLMQLGEDPNTPIDKLSNINKGIVNNTLRYLFDYEVE